MSTQITVTGAAIVKAFESCLKPVEVNGETVYQAYLCPAGVQTIGWGHTNDHGTKFNITTRWTRDQCDREFVSDMKVFEDHVDKLAKVPLTYWERDALISWSYNCGGPTSSGVWTALNTGRKNEVPERLARWNKGGGRVLNGLVRRRKSEGLLFQGKITDALKVAQTSVPGQMPQSREIPTPTVPELAARTKREVGTAAAGTAAAGGVATTLTKSNEAAVATAVLVVFAVAVVVVAALAARKKWAALREDWA